MVHPQGTSVPYKPIPSQKKLGNLSGDQSLHTVMFFGPLLWTQKGGPKNITLWRDWFPTRIPRIFCEGNGLYGTQEPFGWTNFPPNPPRKLFYRDFPQIRKTLGPPWAPWWAAHCPFVGCHCPWWAHGPVWGPRCCHWCLALGISHTVLLREQPIAAASTRRWS